MNLNGKSFIFRINDNGEGLHIVRSVFLERGWIEYDEDTHDESEWNVWWRSSRFRTSDYDNVMSWQRLNHYPKSTTITRKDGLARNLKRMKGVYGSSVYNFCPLSFNVPNDYTKFVAEYTKLKQKTDSKNLSWICKPIDMSRGRGIFIFKDLSELQYNCSAVVQRYITNPMLISGYKFDLRLYVAVPSFHPLNIYIHQESIVRFSTEKYDLNSLNNVFAHLTNSSINKYSPNYSAGKERVGPGCKWTLTQLRYYFHQNNIDDRLLWQRIINIVTLTLITQSPSVPKVDNCFELYGFDILVDANQKPWLLEVNFSPSLSADCQADYLVKKPVVHDLIDMLNLNEVDKDQGKVATKTPRSIDSHRTYSRLSRAGSVKQLPAVNSAKKRTTPSPIILSPAPPIFGLPLVHQSDDEGCVFASGDSRNDNKLGIGHGDQYKNKTMEVPDKVVSLPPRTPKSRHTLRKVNSKGSTISDSGISSFSGHSENSSATSIRQLSETRSAKLKSRNSEKSTSVVKSLCDLNLDSYQQSKTSDVGNWRFMVRKQTAMSEKFDEEDGLNSRSPAPPLPPQHLPKTKRNPRLSISETVQPIPGSQKKRHSISSIKPWLRTRRSHLVNQRQVGLRGPSKKFGDFYLVFPFNDATLRASQTSLDARVIIREIQRQTKELANPGNTTDSSVDRIWQPVRSSESGLPV
ncbi:hypothetical protein SNE40_019461 [Patella caerulea]|uniref:Tubulin polyglutamylase TTLL2 n=1 Tax=Patella caerulea TaxID=87958 RepID=A0AAN8J6I9_PATCE